MYSACMYVHFSMAIWRKRYVYYDACDDRKWKKEKDRRIDRRQEITINLSQCDYF